MTEVEYYRKKSLVSVEEDEYNEFKGHRSISIEELPPWCFQPNSQRRTRKPASRAINAFLNSGRGGTLYLGIIDDGVVKGIYFTESQKDHVRVTIKDTLARYNPPVPDNMYQVVFVPVLEKNENIEDVRAQIKIEQENHSAQKQSRPHLLRTFDFCWCDKELAQRIDDDTQPQEYVVEVRVQRQKSCFRYFQDGSFRAELPVTYMGEEGKCFFRTSASCKEYSLQACKELAVQQLNDLYTPILKSLRAKVDTMLESEIATKDDKETLEDKGESCSGIGERLLTEHNVCQEVKDFLRVTGMLPEYSSSDDALRKEDAT